MSTNKDEHDPFRISEYLKAALIASDSATEILMSKFSSINPTLGSMGLASWEKSPGDIVTEADLESDRVIKLALSGENSRGDIYSEEGFKENGGGQYCWLVDPLCGTQCYASGLPTFGLSITLLGPSLELILGVMVMPSIKERLVTVREKTVTRNGRPWKPEPPASKLSSTLIGLAVGGSWKNVGNKLTWTGGTGGIISFGSAPYSVFHLAAGHLGAQVFYNAGVEHIAAGAAICEQLGLTISDAFGKSIKWQPNKVYETIVFSWPKYHDSLIGLMEKEQN